MKAENLLLRREDKVAGHSERQRPSYMQNNALIPSLNCQLTHFFKQSTMATLDTIQISDRREFDVFGNDVLK